MQGQTYIFFGMVGSGKGTQAKLLMDHLKGNSEQEVVYVYPGKEYRDLIESGSFIGALIKDSMSRGELQPDELTSAIVNNILIGSLSEEKHLIIDGYPRTTYQSENLEKMMKIFKRDSVNIIYIKLSEEEAIKRNTLRGRHDDTPEGLENRIQEYKDKVVPSMEYLVGKDGYEFHEINGEQSIEEVNKEIIEKLGL